MTTTRWLRISAVLAFLFATGHTLGGGKLWSPMGDNAVLNAMRETHFPIMGVQRSYLDFYLGFGYSISVFLVMQAALLWQLGTLAASSPSVARPMIAIIATATAFCGFISYRFIMPVPAVISLVLLTSLVVSFVLARKSSAIAVART